MANPDSPHNRTNPTPLTIGAEAEGVMGVMGERQYRSWSRDDDLAVFRPFLVRPRPYTNWQGRLVDFESDSDEFGASAQDWLFKEIRKSLAHHVNVFLPEDQGPDSRYNVRQDMHTVCENPYYYFWRVIDDETAKLPPEEEEEDGMSWPGFELLTPAMKFNETNLTEIANVYRWLSAGDPNFQPSGPRTPRTCGFHVHVGIGAARFSAFQMRRIASVAYATGKLLSQLQPDYRKKESEASNCRFLSFLAFISQHEDPATDAEDLLENFCDTVQSKAGTQEDGEEDENYGFEGGFEEAPLDEPAEVYVDSGSLDFSWQTNDGSTASSLPPFNRLIARGSLPSEEAGFLKDFQEEGEDPRPRRSIAHAVNILMRCQSPALVAELMLEGHSVSFRGYKEPASKYGPKPKPTVEWRQMPSTFNPDAAVAWITVVAHLTRAAIDWDWEDLNKLLRRCAMGETEPDKYDVFNLLEDIGCVEQAEIIQDMVLNGTVGSPFYNLANQEGGASQQQQ